MTRAPSFVPRISTAIQPGWVLVHNHVRPARRNGTRGFRFWHQKPATTIVLCSCGWAPEHPKHYRVRLEWDEN